MMIVINVKMFFSIYFLIYGYDKQLVNSITHLYFQSTFWKHEKVHAAEMVFNQAIMFSFEFISKLKEVLDFKTIFALFLLFFLTEKTEWG